MENNPETSGINQYYDMYTETSTTSIVSKGFTVAFATECLQLLYDLRWMILLAFILIIADFWFGMNASKLKGIPIRKSRAGRRTFNKIIDYICYLIMGWCIIVKAPLLPQLLTMKGFILLVSGGIIYTIGAILYGIGKKHKYMHSIFHLCILAGSFLQFLCILLYVM